MFRALLGVGMSYNELHSHLQYVRISHIFANTIKHSNFYQSGRHTIALVLCFENQNHLAPHTSWILRTETTYTPQPQQAIYCLH